MFMEFKSESEIEKSLIEDGLNGLNQGKLIIGQLANPPKKVYWALPASKSHFIRWLFLSAQTPDETLIKINHEIGEDILSCAKVLEKLGVKIIKSEYYWIVNGCKPSEFNKNPKILDCGNSATTFRFLSFLIARNGINATITGDESLQKRNFKLLFEILEEGGVVIHKNKKSVFPIKLQGIFSLNNMTILTHKTSQIISGLLITMPSSIEKSTYLLPIEIVSRPYFELTNEICIDSGADLIFEDEMIIITPWKPIFKKDIEIPVEESLLLIPFLFSKLHGSQVIITNWIDNKDSLNSHFILEYCSNLGLIHSNSDEGLLIIKEGECKFFEIDIKDNIDLIIPLSIMMSLSKGGIISGINNAKFKESDRIKSLIYLSNCFSLDVKRNIDLNVSESRISKPEITLFSNDDHRLQMTAIMMLTYTGGEIDSKKWYAITDPLFLEKLKKVGVSIN